MVVQELLESKGIEFRPSGKDYLIRCLNPEHEDRNPSLRVDKTSGVFNCLSCGYSGNLFSHFGEKPNWLQLRRNRLKEIISNKLAETSGLNIPENAVPFDQDWRGISAETFKKFEAFQHNSSEFIGRVVFPIRGISGKIVTFCGRHQGQETPKYLFHPSGASTPLFPIVKPIQGKVIIVEGIMDMLNLHDKGLTNAVCAFGVNKVTVDKINILKIQGVSGIDIFLDSDEAGQNASAKLKKTLEDHDIFTRTITTPKNIKDPGELTALQVIKLKEQLYSNA
jgi:DNA primase